MLQAGSIWPSVQGDGGENAIFEVVLKAGVLLEKEPKFVSKGDKDFWSIIC
jgi:hypothetical protein